MNSQARCHSKFALGFEVFGCQGTEVLVHDGAAFEGVVEEVDDDALLFRRERQNIPLFQYLPEHPWRPE